MPAPREEPGRQVEPRFAFLEYLVDAEDELLLTDLLYAAVVDDGAAAAVMARAMLDTAATGERSCAASARRLLARVPSELTCRTQETFETEDHREELIVGRPDLSFLAPRFRLDVEVKVFARFGERQLANYLAKRSPGTASGLVAVATELERAPASVQGDRRWLGVIRWCDLLTRLRTVEPRDPELRRQWSTLLDYLIRQPELNAIDIDVGLLTRNPKSADALDQLTDLLEGAAPRLLDALRHGLGRSISPRPERRAELWRKSERGHYVLHRGHYRRVYFAVPSGAERWCAFAHIDTIRNALDIRLAIRPSGALRRPGAARASERLRRLGFADWYDDVGRSTVLARRYDAASLLGAPAPRDAFAVALGQDLRRAGRALTQRGRLVPG